MKLKRFFTGVLSAVMALSVCALPAAADDATTGAATTTYTSTIDTSKTGSITIHKYLVKGDLSKEDSNHGEEISADKLPKDGKDALEAAEGVGFTLYKVMNADELVKYYDGVYTNEVTVDDYLKVGTKEINPDKVKKNANDQPIIINPTDNNQRLTDKNGEVKFDGLDIGLYVVVETKKPAAVTEAVEPFLVSVPMTKVGEDGKTNPTEWLYDIHVYPKNSTKVGDVTLEKMGVVGEKNGANKKGIKGVQFKLERQNDGDATKWDVISNPKDSANGYYTTGEDGKVTVSGLKPGNYRFVEIGYDTTADDKKYIIDNNGTYEFTIAVSEDGTTQTVTQDAASANKNNYDVNGTTITIYNYAPDVDKQVYNQGKKKYTEGADYGIGDKIPYQIKVTVPENIAKLKKFNLTDTPTGLTDDTASIVIYTKLPAENNPGQKLDQNAYTVEKVGDDGFEIAFTPADIASYHGEMLYVCYTATLKTKTDSGELAGTTSTDGNPNKINLTYSNKTTIDSDKVDNPENNNQIEDDAVVYTFEVDITKKADSKYGDALSGVMFDLYKQVGNTTTGKDVIAGTEVEKYGFDKNYNYIKVVSGLTTDDDGKVSYKGLANGTYWLLETKTVDGYNLLAKPVKVELSIAYKTSWSEMNEYKDGVLVKHELTKKDEKFEPDKNNDAMNGGTQSGYTVGDDKIGGQETTIINKKGFTLPVTGGFGTLLFSGIGVLLVLAGVAVLFSMKKKNDRA